MKHISNTLEFQFSEIMAYSKEELIDWVNMLELAEYQPIISIRVIDDNESDKEIISAMWNWNDRLELRLFKIECSDELLDNIGPTIMAMIKAIGLHYGAQKVTTSVSTKSYQWLWYQHKMGFHEIDCKLSNPPSPNLELSL